MAEPRRIVVVELSGFAAVTYADCMLIRVSGPSAAQASVTNRSASVGGLVELAGGDELLGQAIKAFVVPREGHPVDAHALTSLCSQKLPRYMVPKIIEALDMMPKTPNAKIDYAGLRQREGFA